MLCVRLATYFNKLVRTIGQYSFSLYNSLSDKIQLEQLNLNLNKSIHNLIILFITFEGSIRKVEPVEPIQTFTRVMVQPRALIEEEKTHTGEMPKSTSQFQIQLNFPLGDLH